MSEKQSIFWLNLKQNMLRPDGREVGEIFGIDMALVLSKEGKNKLGKRN